MIADTSIRSGFVRRSCRPRIKIHVACGHIRLPPLTHPPIPAHVPCLACPMYPLGTYLCRYSPI